MATCYLNGKYLPLSKAKISVTDRGFQFSDGVYEVIASYDGTLIDIDLHLKRLKKSLKEPTQCLFKNASMKLKNLTQ